jgi:Fuc2NAc and GlcNAc transferase
MIVIPYIFFIVLIFIITYISLIYFIKYAKKRGIVSEPNKRTLHQGLIPRGGGIVFSIIYIIALVFVKNILGLDNDIFYSLIIGGSLISIYGFIDDIVNIKRYKKFIFLSFFSLMPFIFFGLGPLSNIENIPAIISYPVTWFLILWFLNAYNFIDGIDGLAISVSTFIFILLFVILTSVSSGLSVGLLSVLLASCCSAFLIFNWPPAKIFMGDSGSLFLGYSILVFLFKTNHIQVMSIWTWLIMLAFVVGDTTTTSFLRLFLVRRWYGSHRSNAYQNLARILDSHFKVLLGIMIYHIAWLLPLTIMSIKYPSYEMILFFPAYIPVIIFSLIYGPMYSSK